MKKLFLLILAFSVCVGLFYNASRADFKCEVYRSGCVVMDNGNEYRPAEVVEVDGNEVTVKIGRDLYAFRGKDFSVGQHIICEITTDDEIIDVMR